MLRTTAFAVSEAISAKVNAYLLIHRHIYKCLVIGVIGKLKIIFKVFPIIDIFFVLY